jgi:toxin ParE1/3/4
MNAVVKKRPAAREDLLSHYVYIGRRSPGAADRFLDAAEAAFSLLASNPEMGRRWESPSPRLAGVRHWTIPSHRNYRIFYRPVSGGIEVLYVFHAAMDFERILDAESGS